ncbi:MAG: M20/M25/M40 family metallo-hydrolase [bacterium]
MEKRRFNFIVIVVMFSTLSLLLANEPVDLKIISEIKKEGTENSEVMESLMYLTDLYGPRLTNSPNYWTSAQWCVDKLTEWGLVNAKLEPWGTFGRGWAAERYSIEMLEPQYMNIIAHPKAWTPGTKGTVSGKPILLKIDSEDDFEKYKGKLMGAIVMTQEPRESETHFEPDAKRHSEEDLAKLLRAPVPGERPSWWARRAEFRKRRALRTKTTKFLLEEGVEVILEPSQREHGTVRVGSGGSYKMNSEPVLPALVVAIEHYSRIARLLENGNEVKLQINIQNKFFDDDSLGYNVVAEIPGTDKKLKNEVVMLGGHLDSWHAGTGATDDAAGCVVAMEAVRILKAIGVKPRRTIRVALWGGEEQGLLGSRGYVEKHFGDRKTMSLKPEWEKFSAYYNLDNGSGKIRGVYLQGNDAVRPVFEAFLKPFHDMGANTVTIRNTGGTDHLAFDAVGLPGFQFIQDPLNYMNRTHHTNMDVYDNAEKSDLIQASIIMASFVYHTAMRDEKLPRKPLPEPQRPPQSTNGR